MKLLKMILGQGVKLISNSMHVNMVEIVKNTFPSIPPTNAKQIAWGEVISWLSRLRMLDGVPFQYIVPSEEMLPDNSIRFFHIDRNWLDALVDGALSVGNIDSRGPFADEDISIREDDYQKLMSALDQQEPFKDSYRAALSAIKKGDIIHSFNLEIAENTDASKRTNLAYHKQNSKASTYRYDVTKMITRMLPDVQVGGNLTGFLLRSSVVRDYPGMEISAFHAPEIDMSNRQDAYTTSHRIDTLKQVRLSDSILFCIFNGCPTHMRVQEPSEGIRLGLDIDPSAPWRFTADYKYEDGTLAVHGSGGEEYVSTIKVRARKRTNDLSVINVRDLLNVPVLSSDGMPATDTPWTSLERLRDGGYVATQLIQFPYQQDFQFDKTVHFSNNSVKVNQNSIILESQDVSDLEDDVVDHPDGPDGGG